MKSTSTLVSSALVILALTTMCAASVSSSETHKHELKLDIDQNDASYYLQGV
jgi:hypothetical protein